MIKPLSQMKEIVAAGGSLIIDRTAFTMNDLMQLATEAAKSNASITITSVGGLTHEQLKDLANTAPGLITFDLNTNR